MRTSLLILGAAAGAAVAQPHVHAHHKRHAHHLHAAEKRTVVEQVVTVTVLTCVLNGVEISQAACDEGVKNGTLRMLDDSTVEFNPVVTSNVAQPAPTSSPSQVAQAHAEAQPQPSAAATTAAPAPAASTSAAVVDTTPAQSVNTNAKVSFSTSNSNVAAQFPSGQLSCNEFPSAYGALAVPWLGLGGWLSVQKPGNLNKRAGGYSNIMTVVPTQCVGGDCCMEGGFCSYACPSGYFKTQWPSIQGSTGQSVGGLQCTGGKLVLSNPEHSTLCMEGSTQVQAWVENKLSQDVSICQTNYPGDEAMTIPLVVPAGGKVQLAIQDAATGWKTQSGAATSAQYYLNPAGVGPAKACIWNGQNTGNWAPMIIGAGYSNNMAYVSLFQNLPTQPSATLDYSVHVSGGSFPCAYQNGQICANGNCQSALAPGSGCTVAASNGQTLLYTLS
ncbi:SUN-domain-containing protein [Microthyrium microscopicum]|uniref:SUN-domain-containing protein n=1 Tax=Microthyrium microscopicum TaxID=703497 RepID=A0A6A6UFI6_9PEZI|nr:SUN-domain-containing protein [Microthyrium microscopicum]